MTWGEIYKQFKSEYPKTEVSDYRPFVEEWLPRDRAGIIVWLKNGDVITYFSKKTEAEGSERGIMVANAKPDKELNEAIKHICDVVQKRIDEAYQRGLEDGRNETWEAARKIVCDESFDSSTLMHIFNRRSSFERIFGDFSASEAIEKLKAYEEKQKADDEIKVGDEVVSKPLGLKGILLEPETEDVLATIIVPSQRWRTIHDSHDNLEKTGKHYDIEKLLAVLRS